MQKATAKRLKLSQPIGNLEDAARQKYDTFRGGLKTGVRYTKRAAQSVNRYSHKNPWMIAGMFAFVAYIFGFFTGMRRESRNHYF
jgi:ElaB/YqjD/DUF883 family membrane-anchored ribosome-binding protein